MMHFKWYKNDAIPSDGDEVVIITFYNNKKMIGYYEKKTNAFIGDNQFWKWEDVECWIKLPSIKKEQIKTNSK